MSEETQNKKDFKSSLKTTGLFGGVQIFKIIIQIINAKFVAVLLGPTGMGISGLLGQTTGLISTFSGLGLSTSAVRDMSEAYATNDAMRFGHIYAVFRKLVRITCALGFLICLLGSPFWSKITFGDYSYTWAFAILSVTFILSAISGGQGVLMQTTKHFKMMAVAGILGSIIGLCTSIPIYYYWGIDGILPAMILGSLTSLILTTYYVRKIPVIKETVSYKTVFQEGKVMLRMGIFLMLQSFANLLCAYLVRIFISQTGSLADVGMYSAGFSVINTYVGMVFTAMGTEYYPRLSTYSNDIDKFNSAINQQIEISLLLTAPLIALFLTFGDLVVILFYSDKFLPITWMINWAILGIFFKAPSWCVAFSFIAKGDSKAFWINEVITETFFLILNVIFYHLGGLTYLGISFLLGYILYFIQVLVICSIRYGYKFDCNILKLFLLQFFLSCLILTVFFFMGETFRYIIGCAIVLVSAYISYVMLNRYMDVKGYIKNKIHG